VVKFYTFLWEKIKSKGHPINEKFYYLPDFGVFTKFGTAKWLQSGD